MTDKPLVPYIRQSRAKEKTISLESQRERIEQWAKYEDAALAPGVVEQGVSGSKSWRERGIGEAIEAVERGEVSGIVVAYQSRLTRENGLGTAEVYDALKAAGARLVCVSESIDTSRGNPDDTEMIFTINAAIARREWARARSNFGEGVEKAKARGVFVGPTPVGFDRLDDSRLVRNADALAVEGAFRVRAGGGSWSETARVLEAAGVRTSGGAQRWSTNSVRSLVANPVYRGQNGLYHFEEYEVVPADVWAAAQSKPNPRGEDGKLARNGRQDGGKRLLGGLIFCGSCGHRMAPTGNRKRNGERYFYYQCKHRACDARAYCPVEVEEHVVRDFLGAVVFRPLPHSPDLTPLESAVARMAEDVAKWQEAVDSGEFDPADALRGLAAAKQRQADAEQALWQAREEAGLNDERLSLAARWATMNTEERRRTLKRFDVRVLVSPGKQHILERVTLEMRGSPIGDGWEPDVDDPLPSDEELAAKIAAEFAAAGIDAGNVLERIKAWNANYADARITIGPLPQLSAELEATADKIFGKASRRERR
jgi:DNA invertase Pin-like site-specific DNA recombinase